MLNKILKNKVFWVMVVIVAVGFFLRAYHFGDWLHYQLDQARDFKIISSAVKYGPGELPLQGPRAAGSFLRLGPWFYYLEYFSALFFGNTPAGSALVIVLFNLVTIPLFYLFIRYFFKKELALGLTGLFAASLFLVVYSRFAWNPNLLLFFILLLFYSLLKITDERVKRKGWWLISSFGALAFIASLHFVALVTMPIIAGIYLLITRPRIAWQWWLGG